ncbi:uncharacterized protein LOC130614575 [Hydractinia symbiolongicarpus]|uniref:uncharacterized protein LOC130614575 n=1 Tax=Hydractinia symbiolongicarpus TaxID=13093 RepID=UPI00254ACB5D|nr:uncharacterized protein LOC130614575 [Hydractinia symbiolongicarpus]
MIKRLKADLVQALGFPDYVTTPNRGKAVAQALRQKVDDILDNDIISMESIEEFVDATESLTQETSFGGTGEVLTECEIRGFNQAAQTIRGNLKDLKSKMILYDSEIRKAESKVKGEQGEKQNVGADEGQIANLEREIAKLEEKIAGAAGGAAGKGFVEKQLEQLGKFLKYLAGEAGAPLPGIMGTIVSFFLRVAAIVVEYVAKHLYMAMQPPLILSWSMWKGLI